MAARRTASVEVQGNSHGFATVLASAVLEWLLIFLLFAHAVFSYVVTKFARYCELETPCLLCSRLDHLLSDEKPRFYWNLICRKHKFEISSLIFCHVHDKLVDVHGLCEGCLLSFATENKSNSETYRLLVGKLGTDIECCVDQDTLLKGPKPGSLSTRHCSCCKEPWVSRSYAQRFLQSKKIESEIAELDVPLPERQGRVHLKDHLKMGMDKPSGLIISSHAGNSGFDPLCHIGYTELKITSDTESEVPFSDDDDGNTLAHEADDSKDDFVSKLVQLQPDSFNPNNLPKVLIEDRTSEKLIDQASAPMPSLLITDLPPDVCGTHDVTSSEMAVAAGCGVEELNWHQVEQKAECSPLPELISLDDVPSFSGEVGAPVEVSANNLETIGTDELGHLFVSKLIDQASAPMPSLLITDLPPDVCGTHDVTSSETAVAVGCGVEELNWHQVEQKAESSPLPELISLVDVPPLSGEVGAPVEVSANNLETIGTDELGHLFVSKGGELFEPESDMSRTVGAEKTCVSDDPNPSLPNNMDLSDAYKLATGNNGRQLSGMLAEQFNSKDSARISEDLKLLLSQISTARGIELPPNDLSPGIAGHVDEQKLSDASSSTGIQLLQKRISFDRNESGFESLDGSIVSEIEGESVVDRLKRQVEYDRKTMSALYKELEEERSASAVAANQAMAMITRLQEEKAALHMEALQYLRMMEEQSEYDVDALQKAHDLLAEREKEIQDLEMELEYYRKKFWNESLDDSISDQKCELNSGDAILQQSEEQGIENPIAPSDSVLTKKSQGSNEPERTDTVCGDKNMKIIKNPLLESEDEKLYISQRLRKLEKKLHLFSNNGVYADISNGGHSGEVAVRITDHEEHHNNEEAQVMGQMENGSSMEEAQGMGQMEGNGSSMEKDAVASRKSPSAQEGHNTSVGEPIFVSKEINHCDSDGNHFTNSKEIDLVALGNEVSDLNARLEALEADWNFLEHTVNSLRNGDLGLKFIQEIALHLRELRSIGLRRDEDVA